MQERRFKMIIDKKGNIQIETKSGFSGNECNYQMDQVMECIGGTCTSSKSKDNGLKPNSVKEIFGL